MQPHLFAIWHEQLISCSFARDPTFPQYCVQVCESIWRPRPFYNMSLPLSRPFLASRHEHKHTRNFDLNQVIVKIPGERSDLRAEDGLVLAI